MGIRLWNFELAFWWSNEKVPERYVTVAVPNVAAAIATATTIVSTFRQSPDWVEINIHDTENNRLPEQFQFLVIWREVEMHGIVLYPDEAAHDDSVLPERNARIGENTSERVGDVLRLLGPDGSLNCPILVPVPPEQFESPPLFGATRTEFLPNNTALTEDEEARLERIFGRRDTY